MLSGAGTVEHALHPAGDETTFADDHGRILADGKEKAPCGAFSVSTRSKESVAAGELLVLLVGLMAAPGTTVLGIVHRGVGIRLGRVLHHRQILLRIDEVRVLDLV